MSQIAKYAAIALPGVNKSAKLQADETGYYKCILGGFNLENHSGPVSLSGVEVSYIFEIFSDLRA